MTQPERQPQVVYVERAPAGTSGLAIASLVLGILWIGGLGALLAVIFGAIGMKQTRDGQMSGRGLAVAGLTLGIIGVIGAFVMYVSLASATNTPINDCFNGTPC